MTWQDKMTAARIVEDVMLCIVGFMVGAAFALCFV